MASAKIIDLLKALKVGTDTKQLYWEDLPDEETFRTQIGGGLVRIGMATNSSRRHYTLALVGINGGIAAEIDFSPDEPGYELIEEVYTSARLAARGGELIIDNIIRQLNPSGK
jgi:hypothetical protein